MKKTSQPKLKHGTEVPTTSLALLTMLLLLALLYRRLVGGCVLAGGDLQTYFFPYWTAAARAWRAGRLPLWNPQLFAGAPLLANSQVGFFYPLNWLLWSLSDTTLTGLARSLHWSVLLHLGVAALTAWRLARKLGAGPWGAALSGLLYAGGGFLGVHVEHLNQLQGLAWLPLVFESAVGSSPPKNLHRQQPLSILAFALILLAGHTQTAFIAAVGVIVLRGSGYLFLGPRRPAFWRFWLSFWPFGLAVLLAGVQLFPTFELAQFSLRAGGLPWREAVSFSVAPWQLHHALLPPYLCALLFPEGVAYLGLVGLFLAGWGGWRAWSSHRPELRSLLVLVGVGLFLALGGYNPLYLLAARLGLPGVVQFRAPARYLALYTLGAALLAGLGFSAAGTRSRIRSWRGLLFTLLFAELLFSAERLPHADATAPRAYSDLRPATAQLVAAARAAEAAGEPPGRFLSISQLLFEVGDERELESLYADALSPDAFWAYLVAAKAREVLTPNLPLAFQVPAVDGYDGGLLPLRHYAEFTRLLLPGGTVDGRLRENLDALPDERWLSLLNVRFLITDKVADTWAEGVFYDRQFRPALAAGETLTVAWLPEQFTSNALALCYAGTGEVTVLLADGGPVTLPLPPAASDAAPITLTWPDLSTPTEVAFHAGAEGLQLSGAALLDTRTGAFYSLVLSDHFRLAHSGDVKIYENLRSQPRAFLVHAAVPAADDAAALVALRAPAFDPAAQVVLAGPARAVEAGQAPPPAESVRVLSYAAERVELAVEAARPGYVVLTDAWYPGWEARIAPLDAEGGAAVEVEVLRADLLFRAVQVEPGSWRLTFTYRPRTLYLGAGVTLVGLCGLGLAVIGRRFAQIKSKISFYPLRRQDAKEKS